MNYPACKEFKFFPVFHTQHVYDVLLCIPLLYMNMMYVLPCSTFCPAKQVYYVYKAVLNMLILHPLPQIMLYILHGLY